MADDSLGATRYASQTFPVWRNADDGTYAFGNPYKKSLAIPGPLQSSGTGFMIFIK